MLCELISTFTSGFSACVSHAMLDRQVMSQSECLPHAITVRLILDFLTKHGMPLNDTLSDARSRSKQIQLMRESIGAIVIDGESLIRDSKNMTPYHRLPQTQQVPTDRLQTLLSKLGTFEGLTLKPDPDVDVFLDFVETLDVFLRGFQRWLSICFGSRPSLDPDDGTMGDGFLVKVLSFLLEKYGVAFLTSKDALQDGGKRFMHQNIGAITRDMRLLMQ